MKVTVRGEVDAPTPEQIRAWLLAHKWVHDKAEKSHPDRECWRCGRFWAYLPIGVTECGSLENYCQVLETFLSRAAMAHGVTSMLIASLMRETS